MFGGTNVDRRAALSNARQVERRWADCRLYAYDKYDKRVQLLLSGRWFHCGFLLLQNTLVSWPVYTTMPTIECANRTTQLRNRFCRQLSESWSCTAPGMCVMEGSGLHSSWRWRAVSSWTLTVMLLGNILTRSLGASHSISPQAFDSISLDSVQTLYRVGCAARSLKLVSPSSDLISTYAKRSWIWWWLPLSCTFVKTLSTCGNFLPSTSRLIWSAGISKSWYSRILSPTIILPQHVDTQLWLANSMSSGFRVVTWSAWWRFRSSITSFKALQWTTILTGRRIVGMPFVFLCLCRTVGVR